MSRKHINTLFITLNLLTILTFNTLLLSCDELTKSTISKKNIQIEITSEPKFFSTVKETLDSFDNGVFVAFEYLDPEEQNSKNKVQTDFNFNQNENEEYYSESNYGEKDFNNYYFDDEFDSEANVEENFYANYDSENEELLESELSEELDLELLQLQNEMEAYNPYDKSEEELAAKLNQVSALVSKLKQSLNEDPELMGSESFEAQESLGSQEDQVEYYDEDNQNAVLRQYAFERLGDSDHEKIGDCEKRNIKRLSLWTMFNMETEVKFNLNSVI